jgi:3-dehydroquinate synthase II
MLKELWIEVASCASDELKLALEKLAFAYGDVLVEGSNATFVKTKEVFDVISLSEKDAVNKLMKSKKKILSFSIGDKEAENSAVHMAEIGADYLVIKCENWKVIPLENLIARVKGRSKIIAEVTSAEEAKTVLEVLEIGTDGVLLKTADIEDTLRAIDIVKPSALKLAMSTAKIIKTKPISNGARVCVDTCDMMEAGEGMLVGSQSAGLFLVEAEVNENPYVASRPFRVNAGSLSMYTLGNLQTTRYLQEFKAGDEVVVVNREGKTRKANVGRIKIEIRPLILLEAQVGEKIIKTILQNAETIRVVTPEGSKPVTELKLGDEVVVHLSAKGGRHFGVSVPEETVIEK